MLGTLAAFAPPAVAVDWSGRSLPPGISATELTVDGITTRVLQGGDTASREAIVMVHGYPGASLDYVHLLEGAADIGRVVSFDMAGFGQAADPADFPYSIPGEAAFLDKALAALGIDTVHLAAHDFGGPFGLEWAKNHPERLKSAVLFNTGVFINYYGHPFAYGYNVPGVGESLMGTQTRDSFGAALQAGTPRPLPPEFLDRMYAENDEGTKAAALKLYRSFGSPDAGDRMGREQAAVLRQKERPALVIWGETDPYVPVTVAYEQDEAFPGARVELLDSGHFPFVDNVEKVDALAIPFWREVVGRPPAEKNPQRPATRQRLHLVVRPRVVRRGVLRSFTFRVTAAGRPVAGARIRLGRKTVTTGRRGPREDAAGPLPPLSAQAEGVEARVAIGSCGRACALTTGPSIWSSFHVIGTVFDKTVVEGTPGRSSQAINLAPAQGGYVEFTLDEEGTYPFVNHAFGDMVKGSLGVLKTENAPKAGGGHAASGAAAESQPAGKAGKVTFSVKNDGATMHGLALAKTPVSAEGGHVDDAALLFKGKDLAGGESETITADLKPGTYELVCHIAGHYLAGQKLTFTVE
jgi:pimeloyl-ACP methyl ester carboxylesterase